MFSLLPCPLLQKDVARCSVLHFSWFLVVSRLVQNECKVSTEGTLLFSSVDPNIKVTFPPGVTEETRSVKLQVCMPKKGSPGQPLVQLLTYVKQQNTRWNVCSRVSSVLTWMLHGLTHLLALSALVFLPAKWAVLQAAPCWKVGFLVVLLPADQHEDIMKRSIICFLFHYKIHWAWQNSSAREICRDYLCRSNSRANPLKLVVVL